MPAESNHQKLDREMMSRALDLAILGEGHVEPNPMVGCVIAKGDQIIAEGHHECFGGPHAEINALAKLKSLGDAVGATAYVTLEPCCHTGKTPPCTRSLIESGVARVVIALTDPFPKVAGGGIRELQQVGVQVDTGVLADEASEVLAPYLKLLRTGRPWVVGKWAMTLDGKIATRTGESQWITGKTSRKAVHQLRGRVDAIAAGMGTIKADNPLLTARPAGPRIATRLVFCQSGLPNIKSQLVQSIESAPLILIVPVGRLVESRREYESRGVEFVEVDSSEPRSMVRQTLDELGRRMMTNLMVEGGGRLLASFLEAGELDECHVYLGPKVFGGESAQSPIAGQGIASLVNAPLFQTHCVDRFDDDVRIIYRLKPESG